MFTTNYTNRYYLAVIWCLGFLALGCQKNPGQETPREQLFRAVPTQESGVEFRNDLKETPDLNIVKYLYFYNGAGVAIGDLNQDSLPDLFFTANQGRNQLYLNRGKLRFEEATAAAGIAPTGGWSTGVTMADVNGDGALDIYVCQVGDYLTLKGRNYLYINDGKGHFSEQAEAWGLDFRGFSTQAAFFDYDRDGDLDCYLLNHSVHSPASYGEASIRNQRDALGGDRLYRNDGSRFVDVSAAAGIYGSRIGYGLGVATADFNNDGWIDLYISNDFHENDYLYFNQGNGTFKERIRDAVGHTSAFSMGNDAADINNDGWLDLLSLDMRPDQEELVKAAVGPDPYNIYQFKLGFGYYHQYSRNMLQLNQGVFPGSTYAQFSEIGELAGVASSDWSWAPLFADFDNDGWKDLFVGNGIWRRPNDLDYLKYISSAVIQGGAADLELAAKMPAGQVANAAWRNRGDLRFEPVAKTWGLDQVGCSTGAAYGDLDRDGDLDLVLNNLNAPASILANQANAASKKAHLQIELRETSGNTLALGARVSVFQGAYLQIQELFTTRGFQSAVEPMVHFGLRPQQPIDSIVIRWPDGSRQKLTGVKANQRLVVQKSQTNNPRSFAVDIAPLTFFRPVERERKVQFTHTALPITDFEQEQLLPQAYLEGAPALVTGDLDGDDLADVVVGDAELTTLYQQPNGVFRSIQHGFARPQPGGYQALALVDANRDGRLDLLTLDAGLAGEMRAATGSILRLWINRGGGKGFEAPRTTWQSPDLASCLTLLDGNGDGLLDLFVGVQTTPGSYGIAPPSILLENNGQGQFLPPQGGLPAFFKNLGMVAAAQAWLDGTTWHLAVVGPWMPVTILTLEKGTWTRQVLPESNGWWQALHAADLDGDGDQDLLLGNLGWNAYLQASAKQPLRLFVADFDQNFRLDPILAHYRQGRQYPFFSKDELSAQLPILRKKIADYRTFAQADLETVFSPEALASATQQTVVTLASAIAWNEGSRGYRLEALPAAAQVAPIRAFLVHDCNGDQRLDVILAGNSDTFRPAIGRLDGSFGQVLLATGQRRWLAPWPRESGWIAPGVIGGLGLIQDRTGKKVIIVTRKNAAGLAFELRIPQ